MGKNRENMTTSKKTKPKNPFLTIITQMCAEGSTECAELGLFFRDE